MGMDSATAEMDRGRVSLRVIPVVTIAVVVAIAAVSLARGVGMNPDGAVYQSAAEHLASGRGYVDYTGGPISVFPPTLPAALAVLIWVGASPHAAWALVNLGALLVYLLATWGLLRLVVESTWVRLGLFAVVATGTGVFTSALSDPLFAAVTAVFVLMTARLVDRPSTRTGLGLSLAALVASLSFTVRYSGAFYIAAIIGLVVVLTRRARLVAFTVLAAIGVPAILLAWNQTATGSLMGQRFPSAVGPVTNAKNAAVTLVRYFALWPAPKVFVVAGLTGGIVAVFILRSLPVGRRSVAVWLAVLAVGFPFFMVVSASVAPVNPLDPRLLFSTLVPLVACLGCVIDPGVVRVRSRVALRRLGVAAGAGAVAIAAGSGLALSVLHAAQDDTSVWNDPAVAQALAGIDPTVRIHSNAPDVVWFYTGRDAYWTPSVVAYRSTYRPEELSGFLEYLKCTGPVSIAWLNRTPHGGLYGIAALAPGATDGGKVTIIAENEGGASSRPCVDPLSFGQGTGLR